MAWTKAELEDAGSESKGPPVPLFPGMSDAIHFESCITQLRFLFQGGSQDHTTTPWQEQGEHMDSQSQ